MSIRHMDAVLRSGKYGPGETLILVVLADHADDDGECFPKVETIAERARCTPRSVQRALRKFEEDGLVSTVEESVHHKPRTYVIDILHLVGDRGDNMSPLRGDRGDICDTEGRHSRQSGVTSATSHNLEPSVNRQLTKKGASAPAAGNAASSRPQDVDRYICPHCEAARSYRHGRCENCGAMATAIEEAANETDRGEAA